MKLGDLIRRARKEHKLSQRALAALIGVHHSAVAQWETHHTGITTENMTSLRRVLGIEAAVEPSPGQPYPGQIIDDPDELALVAFWRSLTRDERAMMLRLLNVGIRPLRAAG